MSTERPPELTAPPEGDDAAARPDQHSIDVVQNIPGARRLLATWFATIGLDQDGGADLHLAVGELVTNAVRHGKAPIRLTMTKRLDRIRIEVHDHGGGRPAIRPVQITGPNRGGWGLRMVDQLVDAWGTTTTGDLTTVWVEQPLSRINGRS